MSTYDVLIKKEFESAIRIGNTVYKYLAKLTDTVTYIST